MLASTLLSFTLAFHFAVAQNLSVPSTWRVSGSVLVIFRYIA